jgi:hypothetical protein
MNALIFILFVVLGAGLCGLWLWWTNRRVKSEYRDRWNDLNRRVGGVLPHDYDKLRKD